MYTCSIALINVLYSFLYKTNLFYYFLLYLVFSLEFIAIFLHHVEIKTLSSSNPQTSAQKSSIAKDFLKLQAKNKTTI